MDTLSIKKGRIIIYRLFDVASEINLSLVESQTREGARRLRLSKYPSTKAIEFANPPVSVELQGFNKPLFGQDTKINVTARAYDFGVISIALDIPIPPGDWHDYMLLSTDMRTYDLYADSTLVRQGSFAHRFITSSVKLGRLRPGGS